MGTYNKRDIKIGQKFGKWTVTAGPFRNEQHQRVFMAQCECGWSAEKRANDLTSGVSKSCFRCRESLKRKNLKGKCFGDWKVIDKAEVTPCGRSQWLCRCKCGAKYVVRASNLLNKASKRCRDCAYDQMRRKADVKQCSGLR